MSAIPLPNSTLELCEKNFKKLNGQFFTVVNPFIHTLFFHWIDSIENFDKRVIVEPFAGSNNIINMIEGLGFNNFWHSYDIDPVDNELNNNKKTPIIQRDTINHYPRTDGIVITNPPYLAKNSATRSGLDFPDTIYDDLYKLALDVMLTNTEYVAAIIPESFMTQGLFHNRLYGVISLTARMFNDTECPVCLALFSPEDKKENPSDFFVYSGDRFIGSYVDLQQYMRQANLSLHYKFNDPNGQIGLIAIDGTSRNSIRFVKGEEIASSKIKASSRSITRIAVDENISNEDIESIIQRANSILEYHRLETSDLFMTPFKGLRKDGKYRRRLSFAHAKQILNIAAEGVL